MPAPTITSVAPVSGPSAGGTAVTITGTNFQYGATVTFDAAVATSVVSVDPTTITCVAPAHVVGVADVWVVNPDFSSAVLPGGFTFNAPDVNSVALWPSLGPATGPDGGGTAIIIYGTDFVSGATVTIGGRAATGVLVSGSQTEIQCTTPRGTAGARDIVVTNPDGVSATLAGGFTYFIAVTTMGSMLARLLPPGTLWNLDLGGGLQRLLVAIGDEFARVLARGINLVDESDPRTASETLADWERMLGLPDDLVTAIPATTEGRRVAIAAKYAARGGQSYSFFSTLCSACGYPLVSITLYANEVLRCGPTSLAAGFVFRVNDRVYGAAYAYAMTITVGAAAAGALTHAQFEAVIRRATHSHIQVMFTY